MLTHPSQPTPTAPTAEPIATEAAPIRVLLVDDHPSLRLGVRLLIDDQPDMQVVAEARSADEALGASPPIDVAIVDYHLGDGPDGLWLTAHLKRRHSPPRVLIYSAFADAALAVTALIAGADGLLGKDELGEELCRAIRNLARGHHHLPAISDSVAQVIRRRLDSQDQAIFGMLLHHNSSDEIMERLGITQDDVHTHRLIMLGSFKPARPPSSLPKGARSPLDYERPKRRAKRRGACS